MPLQSAVASARTLMVVMGIANPNTVVVRAMGAALVGLLPSGCSGGGGGGKTPNDDFAAAAAIQPDGRIVVAGESSSAAQGGRIALARYNVDGSLDQSFGGDGKVLTVGAADGVGAVALQSDGKIVVVGDAYDGFNNFALTRYEHNGSLDMTFGAQGTVHVDMDGGARAVAIQGDGKILAAGYSSNGIAFDFGLVRVGASGALDTTFGSGGKVITYAGGGLGRGATDMVLQADGKIVVAGGSYIVRYNDDGSLDESFGVLGALNTGSYYEQTSAVAVQSDGKITAAGSSYNAIVTSYNLALTRYLTDGSPDTAFGVDGRAVTVVTSLYTLEPAIVVTDSIAGTIVAAGLSQFQVAITRNNSDGSPDVSFANGGKLITTTDGFWSGTGNRIGSIAVQSDGRILVIGSCRSDASGDDFALTRLNTDGSFDASFGLGGTVTTRM
jgi:uncharacterized delta-60 repeat protein